MTAADVLDALVKANLASGAAILVVVALRKTARSRFGARLAYGLWLLPVLAGAAALLPARQVVVVRTAAPAAATFQIGRDLGVSHVTAAPAGLDGPTLTVGLWLAGVAAAALVMAVLQHRFIVRARRGGVGPAVIGLIAPRIFIPADFAERYSPKEQALVLAHEEAHLARQDSRLNGLAAVLQCLCWFNPLVHIATRLMRVDQELACDETVANRFPDARRAYAEVLMKAQLAVLPLPLGCYWPARSPHPLVERVAMLNRPRIGRTRWRAGAVALGCLWAGAGVAAWASQPAEVRMVFKAAPPPGETAPSDSQAADATAGHLAKPSSAPAPGHTAAFALAKVDPPPQPAATQRGAYTATVERVVIEGNHRVDQATILSTLAIRPGQVLTGQTLEAAIKRLADTGQFADTGPFPMFEVHPPPRGSSGDLVVRVREAPLINQVKLDGNANFNDERLRGMMQERPEAAFSGAKLRGDVDGIVELYREAGWPHAKVTFKVVDLPQKRVDVTLIVHEGAKSPPGDLPTGLITISAEHANREEGRHRVIYRGNVVTVQRGRRVLSDLLVLSSRASGEPGGPGITEALWEGNVRLDIGDQAATADRAVYDGGAKAITLSGHVVVQRGPWVVKNDQLVINVRD